MEITIKIDKRSKQAKAFYEYLKTLPFVELGEPRYNRSDLNFLLQKNKQFKSCNLEMRNYKLRTGELQVHKNTKRGNGKLHQALYSS